MFLQMMEQMRETSKPKLEEKPVDPTPVEPPLPVTPSVAYPSGSLPPPPGFPSHPQYPPIAPTSHIPHIYTAVGPSDDFHFTPHPAALHTTNAAYAPYAPSTPPNRPPSFSGKAKLHVSDKAWPKYDGTGSLDTFLTKMEYFLNAGDVPEDERPFKLISLLKGRAFDWLAQ